MIDKSVRILLLLTILLSTVVKGQEGVFYTGDTKVNVDYHHGEIPPAMGVHNIQVMRANREKPETADGLGWTYNHAPNLAYWNNQFYLQYLNDPVGEHIAPGRTMLSTSKDGYNWSLPETIFPEYPIPDGTFKEGAEEVKAKNQKAVMHQRMGFYVPESGDKLLCFGYYGIALNEKDSPNDGKGIGRVVREINKDGSFGPIYFIRYNSKFSESNTTYPFYKKSKDKAFVAACDELLSKPLMMQQWVEEADRDDPLIPLKKQYKAFSYYYLPDGDVIGLWKHALTAVSKDEGKTWTQPGRAKGFVNSNAKIWGQQTSDGKYVTVYNPSEFRWPLALSVSDDGLNYENLLLVNGEISTMRYGGNYKSYGPQYVRGILEGNGTPPDGNLWVTYSMNKEDIWVTKVEVPILAEAPEHVDETFSQMPKGSELDKWNFFSPRWAPVSIEENKGDRYLTLRDHDAFDYATADRLFPASQNIAVEFEIMLPQNAHGTLQVELQDRENNPASRIIWDEDGYLKYKDGYRVKNIGTYNKDQLYKIRWEADVNNRFCQLYINGKHVKNFLFFNPVQALQRIQFRTGEVRRFPNADTPTDQDFDVDQSNVEVPEAVYYIKSLKTESLDPAAAVLDVEDYKKYVDYFNQMEDENIVQAIPNDQSWDWMKENIPLFDCPQENFREMYYYRWWSFRKHIKETPVGNAITEFLVERSYADKYNLIACAIGHHTYESRWLHNADYLKSNLNVWYRGNDGGPMNKLHKFSSWTPDAVYNYYLQSLDTTFVLDFLPDLIKDYEKWEEERQTKGGLFWQEDVKDGMEEQISGGRKVENRRPTINSYMYANARAISSMAQLAGKDEVAETYWQKANDLKQLVVDSLWNADSTFFETVKEKGGFAQVREAIGYIPWYFNLPDEKHNDAWKQVLDEEGFLAPFGLTTAERRHPDFRSHGCCKCEWDGAVWPFSTSQVLTGMANLMNNYNQEVINEENYFDLLETYVESQYYRGRPYIGEYLDETTGYWLKGDQERSRYYNHSTFNDLIITGLVGLRPRTDNRVQVSPLLPEEKWDWFCLDKVPYHGKVLTIIWDKTGEQYHRGKGLTVMQDGKVIAHSDKLETVVGDLKQRKIKVENMYTKNIISNIKYLLLLGVLPLCQCNTTAKLSERDQPDFKSGIVKENFIFEKAPYPSCHAGTIEETPQGLVAAWFGGTRERHPDVGIWVAHYRNGQWTEGKEVANGIQNDTLRYPTWNPVLFQIPDGDLLLFYKIGPSPSSWWGMLKRSKDGGRTWGEAEKLPEGYIGPVKNKPVLLENGNLICASSTEGDGWRVHFEITPDFGKTWRKVGPINNTSVYNIIQPSVLKHRDGRLQILCRSRNSVLASAWSSDQGETWSLVQDSGLPNNNSGTDAVSMADGWQLVAYNHVKTPTGAKKGHRTPLNIAVSSDGKHWEAALVIEDSEISQYSYPAVIQSSDGLVHLMYTWRRERMKHVIIDPKKLVTAPIINEKWPEF